MSVGQHLVWDKEMANAYRRGGWTVTEVRPGVWEVVNSSQALEDAKVKAKGPRR